jgi:hypothetical protein
MALAIKFDQLVYSGQICDYSELARLGHVTRARMSQIMSLLNLAPGLQEKLLFLPVLSQAEGPKTVTGRDFISSREVIRLAGEVDFDEQRRLWKKMGDFRTR